MNQSDRRVRRSRRLLGDALLELLKSHDLSKITVRAVTDAADVGYMTFYRHYNGLDDLLVDRIRSIIEEQVSQVIAACDEQGELIFRHLGGNASLYRTLLTSPSAARARKKLEQMLASLFLLSVKSDPLVPSELRARHMAAGVLSLAEWWFEGGMAVPIEHMGAIYARLIIEGNLLSEPASLDSPCG